MACLFCVRRVVKRPQFLKAFLSDFFTLWLGMAHHFFIVKTEKHNKTMGCYIIRDGGLLIACLLAARISNKNLLCWLAD